jgi:hypothetical protein
MDKMVHMPLRFKSEANEGLYRFKLAKAKPSSYGLF